MAPVGRPPIGYEWKDGVGWIRTATGEPYTFEAYIADVRKRQRDLERRRYHDPSTGTRARRRLRTEREAENKPCKRRQTRQLTLHHVLTDFAHPKRDAANDTPELRSEGEGVDSVR